MRRLFLASHGLGALPSFLAGATRGEQVAFVPTAANPLREPDVADECRAWLRDAGLSVHDTDLDGVARDHLASAITAADLVFVSGGDPFYLLGRARETGFDHLARAAVDAGKPYVGVSAGAIVAGPDLEPVARTSPFVPPPDLPLTGLRLVECLVLPHDGAPGRGDANAAAARAFGHRFPVIPIADDEAVIVVDGDVEVVASPARPGRL